MAQRTTARWRPRQIVPAQMAPPNLTEPSAVPDCGEFRGRQPTQMLDSGHSRAMQASLHARTNAWKVSQLKSMQTNGQLFGTDHRQTVWFLHIRCDLGQQLIRRQANRTAQIKSKVALQSRLDLSGEPYCPVGLLFLPCQPAGHFVDRAHCGHGQARFDRSNETLVNHGVEARPGFHDAKSRAEFSGLANHCAGSNAETFRLITGRNTASGFSADGHDSHRLIAKFRANLLLHRGKEGIHVNEQVSQRHCRLPVLLASLAEQ